MPLVNLKKMCDAALRGGYAVGAFNIVDYNSARAVVRAAEECSAPVIVQTSVKTVRHWGPAAIVSWVRELAGGSSVPVVLHLDHCKDPDFCVACVRAGWTSVMIDASSRPFEENLTLTRGVLEAATPAGVTVEAELGEIGGVEEDIAVQDEDAHLADPEKAARFCGEAAVAVFAPAVGTAHGIYKGEPRIAFDRIEAIAKRTGVPLALHGGTGLSAEVFRRCISLGCAKVNISTQIKHAFIDGFCEHHARNPEDYEPLKPLAAQHDRILRETAENIRLFGSAGKAGAA